ncbi:MAG: hypothetical protein QM715_00545 [Nibricoccus sp.]
MRLTPFLFGLLFLSITAFAAGDVFESVDRALTFSAAQNTFRAKLSGTADLEWYHVELPAPGLLFTDKKDLFNPRLTLFLDARWGADLYGFAQVRADNGFDPNAETKHLRLDEYMLRYRPLHDGTLYVQAGQFSTVIGNWTRRHGSWENPFIGAPLPYEYVTPICDLSAPKDVETFLNPEPDEKYEYVPIVWGPAYSSGVAIGGAIGKFDYACEVKNTAPSSMPESWSIGKTGFSAPTTAARVGFRPNMRWNLGLSGSDGAYMLPAASSTFPPGKSRRDYRQRLFGADAEFAWHHLQVWSEVFESRFDVPGIGTVATRAGYIETKYKFTPAFYGGLRLNRQTFSSIDFEGRRVPWARDDSRFDLVGGCRLSANVQCKLQVSWERQVGGAKQVNYAAQLTARF